MAGQTNPGKVSGLFSLLSSEILIAHIEVHKDAENE
jgi:hypothetical protein